MKSLIAMIMMAFSFTLFELNIFRSKKKIKSNISATFVELEYRKNTKRQKRQTYKNKKYKRQRFFKHKAFKLKGSNSKDLRYSNQRKLRRMFRND